jgi:hypothetical protein
MLLTIHMYEINFEFNGIVPLGTWKYFLLPVSSHPRENINNKVM